MEDVDKNKIINYIKSKTRNSEEISYREVKVNDICVELVYVQSVVDSKDLSEFVIKSIANYTFENEIEDDVKEESKESVKITRYNLKKNKEVKFKELFEKKLYAPSVKSVDLKKDDIFYYLYSGFVLFISSEEFLAIELKKNLNRAIAEPTTEGTIKGPKDAFVENYVTNLGLIRKRLKTEKLVIDETQLGRRTKTQIGILYISDIAKKKHVEEIKKKLDAVDIDGILDSNNIREIIIAGGNTTDFPTILSTERPDLVSYYLMQGRIAIVVDNTPFVIILPSFLVDHFKNIEDYYQKSNTAFFMRIIRIIAFVITLITPAVYLALTTFNHEALPTELLVSFAIQRSGVPFPAILEAVVMIISFEFLREGDSRVASTMGSTLSIVGALVIGDAAVSAGIVSPIMIIVIAMTKITGLLFQDINFANAIRNWRIIFLFFSSIAGLFGFFVALIMFIVKVCSINILDTSYVYPFAPADIEELENDTIVRKNITKLKNRKSILTSNITKLRMKKGEN